MGTCVAGGVELLDLHATVAPRRQGVLPSPTLESFEFVPYDECHLALTQANESVLEYAKACANFVLKHMGHLLSSNVENGLRNLELMQCLTQEVHQMAGDGEALMECLDSQDCIALKTLQNIFAVAHDHAFSHNVDSIVSASWADIVCMDRMFGFARCDRCFKTCLDVVLENIPVEGTGGRIKVVECDAGVGQAYRHVIRQLSSQPALSVYYTATDPAPVQSIDAELAERLGITTVEWSLDGRKPIPDRASGADLVILADVLHRHDNISAALAAASSLVRGNGFLLLVEPTSNFAIPWSFFALTHDVTKMSDLSSRSYGPYCDQQTWSTLLTNAGLTIVAKKSDGLLHTVFLCRKISSTLCLQSPKVIDVNQASFSWLEEIKAVMAKENNESEENSSVWLKATKADSGLVGMLNCLRREPNGDRLRCLSYSLLTSDGQATLPTDEQLMTVFHKNLVMNVFRDGAFGSFRHIPLVTGQQVVNTDTAYVNVLTRGDLSSLRWIESPLKHFSSADHPEQQLCRVHYTALNFRDIMLATGKLPPDAIPGDLASQDCLLGMEFSGHDESGKRVMGLLAAKGLASVVDAYRSFLWSVPDSWSLEQAATVPVAYATAYYALVVRGQIRAGETVLIHSGSGAVGQAAISISLRHGCRVLTTVGTAAKRTYLQQRFPELNESSFADSRDSNFWRTLRKVTGGRGVDVILNSLAEDKLQSSVQLLAQHGRFLEIGKFDLSNNTPLGMAVFLRNISFHGILLDALFEPGNPDWQAVHDLVSKGISNGTVKPLLTTVFERDDVEAAFRFMAQGKHVGKVLIKVRDNSESASLSLPAIKRTTCNPHKTHIIVGGLGGFGLELAQWLVDRGARYLVLTSRTGVRTGYQDLRVRQWRRSGVTVSVSTRDVTDTAGARALIQDAASMSRGGVGSVFNLAVVLHDGLTANQTATEWTRAAKPKVAGTKHLDAATREFCGNSLDWFVVFSSVSCGRGNAGQANYGYANSVMERICERRHADGLPGLAIQWGAVGDVGVAFDLIGGNSDASIGGTLPQRITSCLATLDQFLCQPHAVLSSFVLAKLTSTKSNTATSSTASLSDAVAHILGIKDASSVGHDRTLGDLGLDSLMGVEIKQTLERDYDISMAAKEIRGLTFAMLDQLSNSSMQSAGDNARSESEDVLPTTASSVLYELHHLCPSTAVVEMNDAHTEACPVFVIHPIEGSVFLLTSLMSKIQKAKVYGIQCTSDTPLTSVPDLATHYIQRIKSICPEGIIRLAGYSFGACVAIEIALQLQRQGSGISVQSLILLDGSHSFVAGYTGRAKQRLALSQSGDVARTETEVICAFVSQFAFRFAPSDELGAELLSHPNWDGRVNHMTSTLVSAGITTADSSAQLGEAMHSFYKKLQIADQYQPASVLSASTRVSLVRAADNVAQVDTLGEDYGIGSICDGRVNIHVLPGTHESFVTDSDSSLQLAQLFDTMISE